MEACTMKGSSGFAIGDGTEATKSTLGVSSKSVWALKGRLPLKLPTLSPPKLNLWPPPKPRPTLHGTGGPQSQKENVDVAHKPEIRQQDFRRSSSITARHRDTPIYTEQGSPLLGHAFYNSRNSILAYSTPDPSVHSVIVNDGDIENSKDFCFDAKAPRTSIDMKGTFTDYRRSRRMSAIHTEAEYRGSEMSFECVGESLFRDAAAWLSSPLNYWNGRKSECLPHILSQSMPTERRINFWLSDNGSCLDDEDDVLACATALAPSKAHVIEVNGSQGLGLSIRIPPRSSSLGTTHPDAVASIKNRNSWITFGGDSPNSYSEPGDELSFKTLSRYSMSSKWWPPSSPEVDLAITSPPHSSKMMDENSATRSRFNSERKDGVSCRESLHVTISALENHMASFPSNMLLSDSRCTSTIREHLCARSNRHSSESQCDTPLSPALSQDSLFLYQDHNMTNASQQPKHSNVFYPPSLHTNDLIPHDPNAPSTYLLPNLEPLRRIFPSTSNFMRSALYAHLLAYFFISTLTITHNIPNYHRHRTSAISMPSEAATLLGMTEMELYGGEAPFPSVTQSLEDQLRDHIGTLVSEMEGTVGISERWPGISKLVLRSLVEVVTAEDMF